MGTIPGLAPPKKVRLKPKNAELFGPKSLPNLLHWRGHVKRSPGLENTDGSSHIRCFISRTYAKRIDIQGFMWDHQFKSRVITRGNHDAVSAAHQEPEPPLKERRMDEKQ